jgi:hypothetical protein
VGHTDRGGQPALTARQTLLGRGEAEATSKGVRTNGTRGAGLGRGNVSWCRPRQLTRREQGCGGDWGTEVGVDARGEPLARGPCG